MFKAAGFFVHPNVVVTTGFEPSTVRSSTSTEGFVFETILTYGAGALFFAILLIPLMMRLQSPNEELAERLEEEEGERIAWETLESEAGRQRWRGRAASVHLYRREGRGSGSEAEGSSQAAYHVILVEQDGSAHEIEMSETAWGLVAPRGKDLAEWLGVDFDDASYGAEVNHSQHMVP